MSPVTCVSFRQTCQSTQAFPYQAWIDPSYISYSMERKLKPPAGAVQARHRDPVFDSTALGLRVSSRTDEHSSDIQYFCDKTSTCLLHESMCSATQEGISPQDQHGLVSTENPCSVNNISRFRYRLDVALRLRVSTSPYPHFSPRA